MENLNFGDAIKALKEGKKVSRQGWNGKGMFIFLREGGKIKPASSLLPMKRNSIEKVVDRFGKTMEYVPFLVMKTADNKLCPGWLASQTDMLSEDWIILED